MLIRGDRLNAEQRQMVLATFVFRWTFENQFSRYGGECPACAQQRQSGGAMTVKTGRGDVPWHEFHVKLTSDDMWLRDHAFHFVKDGSKLMKTRYRAEPAYLADNPRD